MVCSLHKRITDTTYSSSQAQPRIHVYIYIHTYIRCGRAARRSSALMSKRKIRCSLCPDPCRAIVPCEIVPGQTQPLLHETSCYCSTVVCCGGLPVLDAALHVF